MKKCDSFLTAGVLNQGLTALRDSMNLFKLKLVFKIFHVFVWVNLAVIKVSKS